MVFSVNRNKVRVRVWALYRQSRVSVGRLARHWTVDIAIGASVARRYRVYYKRSLFVLAF